MIYISIIKVFSISKDREGIILTKTKWGSNTLFYTSNKFESEQWFLLEL